MGAVFYPEIVKRAVLDQPTMDNEGVSRGRAVAVGCWYFNATSAALQGHLNSTSTALQQHFNGTSTALQWHFNGIGIGISASIPVDRESQGMPYAGF